MALRHLSALLVLCALTLSTGCCCHRCWFHRRCCSPCNSACSPCNSCCGYGPAAGPIAPIAPIPAPPPAPPVAPLWQHP